MIFEELNTYQKNIQALISDFETVIKKIYDDNKELMNRMNIDSMLLGLNADGTKIGEYHPTSSYEVNQKADFIHYRDFKASLNSKPGYGNVDLFLTGETASKIDFNIENGNILTAESKGLLTDKLTKQYGSKWIGLTEEQKEYLSERIEQEFMRILDNKYKLI